jgi:hypothetical protein
MKLEKQTNILLVLFIVLELFKAWMYYTKNRDKSVLIKSGVLVLLSFVSIFMRSYTRSSPSYTLTSILLIVTLIDLFLLILIFDLVFSLATVFGPSDKDKITGVSIIVTSVLFVIAAISIIAKRFN